MLYTLSHYLYFPGHVHLHPFCNPPCHRTYAPHLCKWGICITKSDCLIQSLPRKVCMIQEQLFWSGVLLQELVWFKSNCFDPEFCSKNLYDSRAIVLIRSFAPKTCMIQEQLFWSRVPQKPVWFKSNCFDPEFPSKTCIKQSNCFGSLPWQPISSFKSSQFWDLAL